MSAEGAVSPARSTGAVITALLAGIALGAASMLVLPGLTVGPNRTVAAQASSPDNSRVGIAWESVCKEGVCTSLALGATAASARELDSLSGQSCDQVVWTPDGKRVGFVIDGSRMMLFDTQSLKHAGTVRLMSDEAARSHLARGVTFSENGRAVTFDDCPRSHSGCRAGVAGIPQ
jgi:hypothetical protein